MGFSRMSKTEAAAMGFCKKACNFAEGGECAYHRLPSHNYLDIKFDECALNEEDVKTMRKEYDLRRKR